MAGPGTLVLSASNSYSSGTNLSGGLLAISNANALGTGTLTLSGGSLDSTTPGITLPNNPMVWNGSFAFPNTNGLNLGSGNVALNGSSTVTIGAGNVTVSGPIVGSANNLTIAGPGALTLTGSGSNVNQVAVVNGGTLAIPGGSLSSAGGLSLGVASGDNGTLTMSGGSVNVTSAAAPMYIGVSGNGAMIMSGTASLTTLSNEIDISLNDNTGAVSTLTLEGSATLTQSGSASLGMYVGRGIGTTATLNIQDNAVLNTDRLTIGLQAPGTVNQTGGTVNITAGAAGTNFRLAGYSGASAVYNISAGALNVSGMDMRLGYADAGTLNISEAGLVSLPGNAVVMGYNSGNGTVNLSGGTLLTTYVTSGTAGSGTFNFNGGTLKAASSGSSTSGFMNGLTAANVQEQGAIIAPNGYNIAIGQSLLTSGSNAVDGGLMVIGPGALASTGQTPTTAPRRSVAGRCTSTTATPPRASR